MNSQNDAKSSKFQEYEIKKNHNSYNILEIDMYQISTTTWKISFKSILLILRRRKNVINLDFSLAQFSYEKLTSQLHNSSVRSLFLSFFNIDITQILFDVNSSNAIIFVFFTNFSKDNSSSSFVCFKSLARMMLRNMRFSNSWENWWEKMLIILSYLVFCNKTISRKTKSFIRREIR